MTDDPSEDDAPPTEAEALVEVAKAIRDLPHEAKRVEEVGTPDGLGAMRQTLAMLDPEKRRQRQREMNEEKRLKRAELRANIAIGIAALGAVASILAVVLR